MRYLARHADHSNWHRHKTKPAVEDAATLDAFLPHRHPNKGAGGEWSNGTMGRCSKCFCSCR